MAVCWRMHMQLGLVQGLLTSRGIFGTLVISLDSYLLLHTSPFPFFRGVPVLCSIVFVVLYIQTAGPRSGGLFFP